MKNTKTAPIIINIIDMGNDKIGISIDCRKALTLDCMQDYRKGPKIMFAACHNMIEELAEAKGVDGTYIAYKLFESFLEED